MTPADLTLLANLRVTAVFPAKTTLPEGIYKSQYTYRDSAELETAVLNVTSAGTFLLIGEDSNTPFLGKEETYSFFEENEEEGETDEDLTFNMF